MQSRSARIDGQPPPLPCHTALPQLNTHDHPPAHRRRIQRPPPILVTVLANHRASEGCGHSCPQQLSTLPTPFATPHPNRTGGDAERLTHLHHRTSPQPMALRRCFHPTPLAGRTGEVSEASASCTSDGTGGQLLSREAHGRKGSRLWRSRRRPSRNRPTRPCRGSARSPASGRG